MAGMLGFAQGMTDEYLGRQKEDRDEQVDIRDENRQETRDIAREGRVAKYQEIQDRRLAEINTQTATALDERKKGAAKISAEALKKSQEADRTNRTDIAKIQKGPTKLGYGEQAYDDDGKLIAENKNRRALAGDSNPANTQWHLRGAPEKGVAMSQLEDIWKAENMQESSDAYGNKIQILKPGAASFFEWFNKHVVVEERIDPFDPKSVPNHPVMLYHYMKENTKDANWDDAAAITAIQKAHPTWKGPDTKWSPPTGEGTTTDTPGTETGGGGYGGAGAIAPTEDAAPVVQEPSAPRPTHTGMLDEGRTGTNLGNATRGQGALPRPSQGASYGPIDQKMAELQKEIDLIDAGGGKHKERRSALVNQLNSYQLMKSGG